VIGPGVKSLLKTVLKINKVALSMSAQRLCVAAYREASVSLAGASRYNPRS